MILFHNLLARAPALARSLKAVFYLAFKFLIIDNLDKHTLYHFMIPSENIFQAKVDATQPLPFFTDTVSAGFPSPAEDYVERQLDLNELLIKNPSATFFVRVKGHSMQNASIRSGDILIVDRSLTPSHGQIIVAVLDGEFTVKRILIEEGLVFLAPENASFSRIKIDQDSQFQVWGVVTYVIHKAQ